MKKIIPLLIVCALFVSCGKGKSNSKAATKMQEPIPPVENSDGSVSFSCPDMTAAIKYGQKVDNFDNVIVISGDKVTKQNMAAISLANFANQMSTFTISCDMKVVNKNGDDCKVNWIINDVTNGIPTFYDDRVKNDTWVKVRGELNTFVDETKSICLNVIGTQKENLTVYLKNFEVKILTEEALTGISRVDWTEAESLKEKYKGIFDYFGLAVTFNGELNTMDVQEGLGHQIDCITMGNEFKPDFLFNWKRPAGTEDFKAEDGKIYQVPSNMPDFGNMPMILFIAQDMGISMRGHVLVWHSQTPEWFFKENYSSDKSSKYVDKATMNAREEWYIKTVLGFVDQWEKDYNDGEHIVKIWDVVNEAVADGAGSNKWLREDSDWYRVYGSEEFIINAFRYANKYAPKDVKLVYNDYNCYSKGKCNAICNLVDEIRSYKDARIDAIGMQSHVSVDYPTLTGDGSFEDAVKKFLAKDVDVQITELDIANGKNKYNPLQLKQIYKDYFELFIRNRKTDGKRGIMGVTIWGITDDGTWLDHLDMYKGSKQYPLLFNGDFSCKPAFYGVLEAADSLGK